MPIYRYEPVQDGGGCGHCREGFEVAQPMTAARMVACPKCGEAVRRAVVAVAVGRSASGLDDRAKAAGFSKLKRIGKGEYETQY